LQEISEQGATDAATTIFDVIRCGMPYMSPLTLSESSGSRIASDRGDGARIKGRRCDPPALSYFGERSLSASS
jgi:hypothetical protein